MGPLAFDIGVHIFVTRTQKVPKVQSTITTRLTDAEQNKIVLDATLRATTSKDASECRESFDGMLRRVVIPWDVVVIHESEKLLSIFLKSFFIANTYFRLKISLCQPTEKMFN